MNIPRQIARWLDWLGLIRLSSAPATPPTGYVEVYFLDADGLPYYKTSDGVQHPLSAGVRRIGFTIGDGTNVITTGVKGGVTVDFAGTIIGWEIIETSQSAGLSSNFSLDIYKKAGTQTVPVVPTIPTDKISASAPISLASASGAGVAAGGLTGWTTAVSKFDSFLWNVTGTPTAKRVTGYLRIQEI